MDGWNHDSVHFFFSKGVDYMTKFIGLPPLLKNGNFIGGKDGQIDINKLQNSNLLESMVLTYIKPMKIEKLDNINNIKFQSDFDTYQKIVNLVASNAGVSVGDIDLSDWKSKGIPIISVMEGSFGESFNNSLGDSFLASAGNFVSDAQRDAMQLTGSTSFTDFAQKGLGQIGDLIPGIGGLFTGAGNVVKSIDDRMKKEQAKNNKTTSQLQTVLEVLNQGNKMDFPKVWKSSSMSQSYTLTTRLYCPDPNNNKSYVENIILPLIYLLVLALPRQDVSQSYKFPFYVQYTVPGNLNLYGMITNLSVVKGGDSMQFSNTQRPYLVDVRLQIDQLYDVMVVPQDPNSVQSYLGQSSLNILNYVDSMLTKKFVDEQGNLQMSTYDDTVASATLSYSDDVIPNKYMKTQSRGKPFTMPSS